jgi:cytochrome c-type biogenesis protein CcmH/NrfG
VTVATAAQQAQSYLELNRPADALRVLASELASNPDNVRCLLLAGQAHLAANPGRHGAKFAFTPVQHAVELDPNNARGWQLLAEVHTRLGAHSKARKAARAGQRLAPSSVAAHTSVVNADVAAKKITRRTRTAAAEALRLAPQSQQAYFTAGYLAQNEGKFRKAAKYYRQALAIDSTYRPAIHNLALIAVGRGDMGRAVAAFAGLLSTDPTYAIALRNLRVVARITLTMADLLLAFDVVLAGTFFRSLSNSLTIINPAVAPVGMTYRAIAAAVAVGGALAFLVVIRRRSGVYFARFVNSLPSIAMPFVVWAIGLGGCIVAMVVAIFVDPFIAVRIYEITGVLLAFGFFAGNYFGRVSRWA